MSFQIANLGNVTLQIANISIGSFSTDDGSLTVTTDNPTAKIIPGADGSSMIYLTGNGRNGSLKFKILKDDPNYSKICNLSLDTADLKVTTIDPNDTTGGVSGFTVTLTTSTNESFTYKGCAWGKVSDQNAIGESSAMVEFEILFSRIVRGT